MLKRGCAARHQVMAVLTPEHWRGLANAQESEASQACCLLITRHFPRLAAMRRRTWAVRYLRNQLFPQLDTGPCTQLFPELDTGPCTQLLPELSVELKLLRGLKATVGMS